MGVWRPQPGRPEGHEVGEGPAACREAQLSAALGGGTEQGCWSCRSPSCTCRPPDTRGGSGGWGGSAPCSPPWTVSALGPRVPWGPPRGCPGSWQEVHRAWRACPWGVSGAGVREGGRPDGGLCCSGRGVAAAVRVRGAPAGRPDRAALRGAVRGAGEGGPGFLRGGGLGAGLGAGHPSGVP